MLCWASTANPHSNLRPPWPGAIYLELYLLPGWAEPATVQGEQSRRRSPPTDHQPCSPLTPALGAAALPGMELGGRPRPQEAPGQQLCRQIEALLCSQQPGASNSLADAAQRLPHILSLVSLWIPGSARCPPPALPRPAFKLPRRRSPPAATNCSVPLPKQTIGYLEQKCTAARATQHQLASKEQAIVRLTR